MSTTRSGFTPDALSNFEHTMDEVLMELLADGVLSSSDVDEARTRLAQKLMRFASSGRSVIQIRQLLSRAVRNEESLARHQSIAKTGERPSRSGEMQQRGNEALRPPATGEAGSSSGRP